MENTEKVHARCITSSRFVKHYSFRIQNTKGTSETIRRVQDHFHRLNAKKIN